MTFLVNPQSEHKEPRPWLRAAGWLTFLGPFFFLSYGFANWWTGQLPHVGSFVFDWEKHIPFWPWTIVPYMALDAFYAGSLYLCATRAELDTHAKRLLSASVLSVAGFLLFPLQFSFERPATSGFNGLLFELLAGFDKPYNQAPSLHISLVLLVWLVFARHLHGGGALAGPRLVFTDCAVGFHHLSAPFYRRCGWRGGGCALRVSISG